MNVSRTSIQSIVQDIQEKDIPFLAASVAYYAFVSLIPLLLLLVVAVTVIGGPQLANKLATQATGSLPQGSRGLIRTALSGQRGAGGAAGLGLIALLWSALKIVRGISTAFAYAYDRPGTEGIVNQIKSGLLTLGAVTLGIGLTVAAGVLLSVVSFGVTVGGIRLFNLLTTVVLLLALTGALLPIYYFLPNEEMSVREVLPGAAFAALGWILLQIAFRYYVMMAGAYAAYGVIGGVLLLVTFLYFASLVLLCGAVLNAALGDHAPKSSEEYPSRRNDREGHTGPR